MNELRRKLRALLVSGVDVDVLVDVVIDVVARGLHRVGGRPAKEPALLHDATAATPVDATYQAPPPEPEPCTALIKSEVSKPQKYCAETSNSSMSGSDFGSSLSLFPDRISQRSELVDRQRDELDRPGFARFWALYPRRVGRKDAQRAWEKIRPSKQMVEVICNAIIWQVETWDAEEPPRPDHKIPHPATWLNGQRWKDERPARRQANGHTPKDTQRAAVARSFIERKHREEAEREGEGQ